MVGETHIEESYEKGLAFTMSYYEKYFLIDFLEIFEKSIEQHYKVEYNWSNFDKLKTVLDRRFIENFERQTEKQQSWYKKDFLAKRSKN